VQANVCAAQNAAFCLAAANIVCRKPSASCWSAQQTLVYVMELHSHWFGVDVMYVSVAQPLNMP